MFNYKKQNVMNTLLKVGIATTLLGGLMMMIFPEWRVAEIVMIVGAAIITICVIIKLFQN